MAGGPPKYSYLALVGRNAFNVENHSYRQSQHMSYQGFKGFAYILYFKQ